ncbi:MAG: hypothetical protein R8P61_06900 [Bacteroidia bacterium]|nr:hypothetical protein [Bacteroidia bacterium]
MKVCILSEEQLVNPSHSLWGHGGWIDAKERESLDYFMFFHFMGWEVEIQSPTRFLNKSKQAQSPRLLVLCGKWGQYPKEQQKLFLSWLQHVERCLLVWNEEAEQVAASIYKSGTLLEFPFSPMHKQAENPAYADQVRKLICQHLKGPQIHLDWQGSTVLRMDDPGSSEPFHHNQYLAKKLQEKEWMQLGEILDQKTARMSIAYVSAWVDDSAGINHSPLQSPSEFRGLKHLKDQELLSIAAHGYTHLYPDLKAWHAATDKHENVNWYREYSKDACRILEKSPAHERPEYKASALINEYFDSPPLTFVFPGEVFTELAQMWVLAAGYQLIASYYLGIRIDNRICWCQQIQSPYLDEAHADFFKGSWPVVAYFHDFDLINEGIPWLESSLQSWELAGSREFIDFQELLARLQLKIEAETKKEILEIKLQSGKDLLPQLPFRLSIIDRKLDKLKGLQVSINGKDTDWEWELKDEQAWKIKLNP